MLSRFISLLAVALVAGAVFAEDINKSAIDQLVPWLLREDQELHEIPFSQVVFAATGKRVFAVDPAKESDRHVIDSIRTVLNDVTRRMNAPDSPVQNVARINEASSHFEDMLRDALNRVPGFSCDFP